MSEIASKPARFPSLDGWRAFSIIAVLGAHSIYTVGFPESLESTFLWMFDGDLGVRMFFTISGFLITWQMLDEHDRTSGMSLKRFYIRRALRLLPVYFAFIATLALLQAFTAFTQPGYAWVANLTFTTNFSPARIWISTHLWSLAVEEQFYLLWPCLFVFLGCGRNLRRCVYILAIPLVIAPLARVACHVGLSPHYFPTLFSPFSFLRYFDLLAIGCLCAVLWVRSPQTVARWAKDRPWLVFSSGVFLLLLPHFLRHYLLLAVLTVPLAYTCQGVGFGLLLLHSMSSPQFGPYPVLNQRTLCRIGILSYSIYIWQQIFCSRPESMGWTPAWWFAFPTWILAAALVAVISYYGLEQPMLRQRAKFRS